jgi:hypothetical protein
LGAGAKRGAPYALVRGSRLHSKPEKILDLP